jgi:hypothetical protein
MAGGMFNRKHARTSRWGWLILLLALPARVLAQCEERWLPGIGAPGADSWVTAMTTWDRDGAGPQPPVLVLGGWFQFAGGLPANCIATWSPTTGEWGLLGTGIGYYVGALAVLPNNNLVAGGWFESAGGVPASGIARFDGAAWHPLGAGVSRGTYDSGVNALVVLPNGDLVAAGKFLNAGGTLVNNIARWDGAAWRALGSGMEGQYPTVEALVLLPDGTLVAGGRFTQAGGVPVEFLAAWDGASWSSFGAGFASATNANSVFSLAVTSAGSLVAGGESGTGPVLRPGYVARWSGVEWSLLGNTSLAVLTLATRSNGDIVAGGNFGSVDGVATSGIARWNATQNTWSPLGSGINYAGGVFSLFTLPAGDVIAGGLFTGAGGVPSRNIARWGESCPCKADLDNDADLANGSLPDGSVTIEDLLFFVAAYEALAPAADLDNGTSTGTPDGSVDAMDLFYFLERFEAGC